MDPGCVASACHACPAADSANPSWWTYRWLLSFFRGVELTLRRFEEFKPRLLEFVHALVLEDLENVGQVDADGVQRVEHRLGLGSRAGDGVTGDDAVVG